LLHKNSHSGFDLNFVITITVTAVAVVVVVVVVTTTAAAKAVFIPKESSFLFLAVTTAI
jgi:hypothetical protein